MVGGATGDDVGVALDGGGESDGGIQADGSRIASRAFVNDEPSGTSEQQQSGANVSDQDIPQKQILATLAGSEAHPTTRTGAGVVALEPLHSHEAWDASTPRRIAQTTVDSAMATQGPHIANTQHVHTHSAATHRNAAAAVTGMHAQVSTPSRKHVPNSRMHLAKDERGEVEISTLQHGDTFGELAILRGTLRQASVIATQVRRAIGKPGCRR